MPLSDTKLRNLKAKAKPYEVAHEHGLFVEVLPSGARVFRYRYRLGGKREKVTIGEYPAVSLKRAQERHQEFRALVAEGKSPAREKQLTKRENSEAKTVRDWCELWLAEYGTREQWRKRQQEWLDRDIYPALGRHLLADVTPNDVLALIDAVKGRGAPQSAIRVRGILKQVYDFAQGRQRITFNPAAAIPSRIIARQVSRDRVLTEAELRTFYRELDASDAEAVTKTALRLLLLTMTRKGELRRARWSEVDLQGREWHIPQTNSKNGKPHIVYLSEQAVALFKNLKTAACGSEFVLASPRDGRKPIGESTLNSTITMIEHKLLLKAESGKTWTPFTPHDLRRTASTVLHEQGFPSDVIEKALNHTIRGVRGVYNRAEYREQRRVMLQQWADYLNVVFGKDNVASIGRKVA